VPPTPSRGEPQQHPPGSGHGRTRERDEPDGAPRGDREADADEGDHGPGTEVTRTPVPEAPAAQTRGHQELTTSAEVHAEFPGLSLNEGSGEVTEESR